MSFLVSYANIATITVPKISQAQIIKHVQQYLNNRKGCFYLFIPIFFVSLYEILPHEAHIRIQPGRRPGMHASIKQNYTLLMLEEDRILKIDIENEMKSAYIDYSMSVIVSRALPDVRDGLKPVQRRVLFGMNEMGNTSDHPHKKSANCVGEVMGKYHPHGDSSIYGTVVRMAQPWALRYTLVDGHGNFGSVDGDGPAAMRYTEVRLEHIGEEMLSDIDSDTVDFQPNYDNSRQEPVVLPTRIPNLLVNGTSGIAVGMATNMPPHNLTESINATVALIDNPELTISELMKYIKAPDFPTGGTIYGYNGVKEAFETGRGRIVIRAKAEIEAHSNHEDIIVTEIPYNVNKAELIKYIADLVNEKKSTALPISTTRATTRACVS